MRDRDNIIISIGVAGLCFGIVVAEKLRSNFSASTFIFFFGLILLTASSFFIKQKIYLFALGFFVILSSFGMARVLFFVENESSLSSKVNQSVQISGYVSSDVTHSKYYRNFKIKTSDKQNILIRTADKKDVLFGEKIIVNGTLSVPENFENESGIIFDYKGYLKSQKVGYIIEKAKIEKTGERQNGLLVRLSDIKKSFIGNIEKVFNFPESALLSGLLVGNKSSLGEENLELFRRAGVSHIIVLSGFNIAIVGVMIMAITYFLPRKIRFVFAVSGIVLFSLAVGMESTVMRATIMVVLAMLGKYIGRKYDAMRALLIAGFIMIMLNPFIVIYDISFQLSFLATLGLVILAVDLEKYFLWLTKKFGIREIVVSTIAVEIFVVPFILLKMGNVSVVSILSNILILPVIAPTMLFGFLSGLVTYLSPFFGMIVGFPAYVLLLYEMFVIKIMAKLPFAFLNVKNFSIIFVLIVYGLVFLWKVKLIQRNINEIVSKNR